jgi:hypothetical protein
VQAAIKQAMAHRPDVLAALGQIDSAEASLKGAQRAYYPVISVAAHAFQNMGAVSSDGKPYSSIDRPGANILLSISIPIYDGGMRSSQISVARAKVREAEEKLDETRDSAAQQVVKAYNGLVTSLSEYEAATQLSQAALSQAAHTAYDAAMLRSYRSREWEPTPTYVDGGECGSPGGNAGRGRGGPVRIRPRRRSPVAIGDGRSDRQRMGTVWVQVGNEINSGMLWPVGNTSNGFGPLAGLIDSGYNAVGRAGHHPPGQWLRTSDFTWFFSPEGGRRQVGRMSASRSTLNSELLTTANTMISTSHSGHGV